VKQSRRQFVGQCATVASTSAVSAMVGRIPAEATQNQPLRNWAGNYQYSTTGLTSATSLAQVQDFVRKQAFASQLISSGCRYAVCAGIDCSAWHDAFDLAWVQQHLNDSEEKKDAEHVMTTWHEGDSIDDVAFFFVYNTNFDEYDFRQFLVLHLGDSPVRHDVDAAVRRNALGEVAA